MKNQGKVKLMKEQMEQVLVGKGDEIELVLSALLARGHVLLEDVPGVGKTTLAKTLASTMEASFGRIQFTPDTLPTDVLGMSIYNMKSQEFDTVKGPVANQIVLADEINRTSPKTQSSLLEAMGEGQITIDQTTFLLPQPFMVIATENPVEQLGTYGLPEAQLDRFMMRLSVGYPSKEQEKEMVHRMFKGQLSPNANAVVTTKEVEEMQKEVEEITLSNEVLDYIIDLARATREEESVNLGISPRATLYWVQAAKAYAYVQGLEYVTPDHVKKVGPYIMAHRLMLSAKARVKGRSQIQIAKEIIGKVKVPC